MMTREEKLTEAKLMAVENIIKIAHELGGDGVLIDTYDYAKTCLNAIRNEEIKAELADHEADLETAEPN